ncbi:glycoside hydrolase family 25 protein [Clostridium sp. C105KSO13]|uniref:glycoside hydrolase family 25 protein n=1 Tax=Clostridium sp. C105KSO13 TaxID=1776045 RepID=UPI0007408271|nr:glycoside hydrolase family 25 protein [Clostridium sp. C105KSO13]CUX29193.1 Autolytic lysozyme [Clostridium sp. C105KSO13]
MIRNIKKVMAGILAVSLLAGGSLTEYQVYAADEIVQEEEQEEEQETTIPEELIPEVEENLQEQTEQLENSWRYEQGEAISTPEPRARTLSYPNAWDKVNGVYVNSIGEEIVGAVKKGIDVSEHQGAIDWAKVKADGINYAIIRCGYGNNYTYQDDKYWKANVSACESLGIPYGVYIYSYATNKSMAECEAEHVLRLINGRKLSYPVYFDMEDACTIGTSAAMKGIMAKAFCDKIAAAGYDVGIYANLDWWNNYLTDSVFKNNSWSKWVAQYNIICEYTGAYDLWQCTSSGRVSGINENVDFNFLMNADMGTENGGISTETTLAVRRGNKYYIKYTLGDGEADLVVPYGYSSDEILVGDWDGDGVDTLCVRRGNTYYFKNSLSSGEADIVVSYGKAADSVLVGDWNGDGVDTLCVRRGNAYHFKNSFTPGEADMVVNYGKSNDTVLSGDWDGNGTDTLCVRRGNVYHIKNSFAPGVADSIVPYGYISDQVLVGDWDGDNIDTICVRRGNAYYIKNSITSGGADKIVLYGHKDDITYVGKWKK